MIDDQLYHHGILGMKWGVRRYQNKDGSLTNAGKKHIGQGVNNKSNNKYKNKKAKRIKNGKKINELTDDELRKRISRLELEKRYKDLSKSEQKAKVFDGKRFVSQVLENSGKIVATQLATYLMGTAINKAANKDIINLRKDKKDK